MHKNNFMWLLKRLRITLRKHHKRYVLSNGDVCGNKLAPTMGSPISASCNRYKSISKRSGWLIKTSIKFREWQPNLLRNEYEILSGKYITVRVSVLPFLRLYIKSAIGKTKKCYRHLDKIMKLLLIMKSALLIVYYEKIT